MEINSLGPQIMLAQLPATLPPTAGEITPAQTAKTGHSAEKSLSQRRSGPLGNVSGYQE